MTLTVHEKTFSSSCILVCLALSENGQVFIRVLGRLSPIVGVFNIFPWCSSFCVHEYIVRRRVGARSQTIESIAWLHFTHACILAAIFFEILAVLHEESRRTLTRQFLYLVERGKTFSIRVRHGCGSYRAITRMFVSPLVSQLYHVCHYAIVRQLVDSFELLFEMQSAANKLALLLINLHVDIAVD